MTEIVAESDIINPHSNSGQVCCGHFHTNSFGEGMEESFSHPQQ